MYAYHYYALVMCFCNEWCSML